MAGELIEATGALLTLLGIVLGIIVTAGVLLQINAPVWLWIIYVLELIVIFIGVVMRVIGEHL